MPPWAPLRGPPWSNRRTVARLGAHRACKPTQLWLSQVLRGHRPHRRRCRLSSGTLAEPVSCARLPGLGTGVSALRLRSSPCSSCASWVVLGGRCTQALQGAGVSALKVSLSRKGQDRHDPRPMRQIRRYGRRWAPNAMRRAPRGAWSPRLATTSSAVGFRHADVPSGWWTSRARGAAAGDGRRPHRTAHTTAPNGAPTTGRTLLATRYWPPATRYWPPTPTSPTASHHAPAGRLPLAAHFCQSTNYRPLPPTPRLGALY